jgi:hypothetical protein
VLVDEHRDLPEVALGPERFCKDRHRATRSSKFQYQWKDAEFRFWNAIKGGKAFFVVALASDGAAHAVANPAPISAQVAHQAEASDATSSVPPQVYYEPIAIHVADRAAYVAGHVHTENTREHCDSDESDAPRQLGRADNLIGYDDRPLFFF